jgi:hypothetical protein
VNEAAHGVGGQKTQEPQYYENNSDRVEHTSALSLLV